MVNVEQKARGAVAGVYATLYSRNSRLQIKIWRIINKQDGLFVEYGILKAKMAKEEIKIPSNTRGTIYKEKIYNMILRKIRGKQNEGYKFIEDIDGQNVDNLPMYNTDSLGQPKVMLAEKAKLSELEEMWDKLVLWQSKYCGVRCTAEPKEVEALNLFEKSGSISYLGREAAEYKVSHLDDSVWSIINFLNHHFGLEDFKLDGELYIHETTLDYIRTCIPIKPLSGQVFSIPSGNPKLVKYVIYDIMIEEYIQRDRHTMLLELETYIRNEGITDVIVDPGKIVTIEKALDLSWIAKENKFEGGIIRDLDANYRFGYRGKSMMKIKYEREEEFKILDIENHGYSGNKLIIKFRLQNNYNDLSFLAVPGNLKNSWDNTRKEEVLKNKAFHIGKMASVSYYDMSSNDIPQNCNVITIRDYE